ncbi:MAG: hypothetical protein ACJ76H_05600 [Bacteriovoracaceae bacterium]
MTRYLFLTSLLALSACSEFPTGRSYLSEMEHNDSSFYTPEEDFPVVGGDAEVKGMSMNEYRKTRLPKSEEDKYADRETQALRQELRALEDAQPDDEREHYNQYKKKLATNSEKIYYLKLPRSERRQYLQDRGLLESPTRTPASESGFTARRNEVGVGMTKSDVMVSFGKPQRVEIAGNPSYENERWMYNINGSSKYIYFESGVVQGWD